LFYEEQWIVHLKAYLQGDVTSLSAEEAKSCAKITTEYDLDESGLLLYCSTGAKLDVDRDSIMRVVVPETLQQDSPLPCQPGRRASGDREDVRADQEAFPLARSVSECPEICG